MARLQTCWYSFTCGRSSLSLHSGVIEAVHSIKLTGFHIATAQHSQCLSHGILMMVKFSLNLGHSFVPKLKLLPWKSEKKYLNLKTFLNSKRHKLRAQSFKKKYWMMNELCKTKRVFVGLFSNIFQPIRLLQTISSLYCINIKTLSYKSDVPVWPMFLWSLESLILVIWLSVVMEAYCFRATHGTRALETAEVQAAYGEDQIWKHAETVKKTVKNSNSG